MPSRPKHAPEPSPELQGLLRDVEESPHDDTPRLVLADWLEERGDVRAALVRLVPSLTSTPRRDGPHPDLPCVVWRDPLNGRLRSDGARWPRLSQPVPPGVQRWSERRAAWRGLHHLGRLLGVALLRDFLAHPDEAEARAALLPFVARWELYNCGLIDAWRRDGGGRVTGPADLVELPGAHLHWRLCLAACLCRAGPFCGYFNLAEGLIAYASRDLHAPGWTVPGGAPSPDVVEPWLREKLRRRAPLYGRFLNLAEAFARQLPWQEARAAWRQQRS